MNASAVIEPHRTTNVQPEWVGGFFMDGEPEARAAASNPTVM